MSDWFGLKLSLILFLGFFGTCFVYYILLALAAPFLKRRVSLTRKPLSLFFLYCIFFPFVFLFCAFLSIQYICLELEKLWAGTVRGWGKSVGHGGFSLFLFCPCRLFSWKRDVLWGFLRQSIIDDCHLFVLASITSPSRSFMNHSICSGLRFYLFIVYGHGSFFATWYRSFWDEAPCFSGCIYSVFRYPHISFGSGVAEHQL